MISQRTPLIVLMTDFGDEAYVGVMKGKILQINPFAKIISLTNHIRTHDIRFGAFILFKSYKYFPHHTIFLVVIDPGVGSHRKAVAIKKDDYYFIGPDNGIFSPIVKDSTKIHIVNLSVPNDVSKTFHGRDIFAPAAAKLSQNYSLSELGSPSKIQTNLEFFWDPQTLTGEVIFIDHFGNIITNLPSSQNMEYDRKYLVSTSRFKQILEYKRGYFEGSEMTPFILENSFETLEIAVCNAKASDVLDITPGDRIQIKSIDLEENC